MKNLRFLTVLALWAISLPMLADNAQDALRQNRDALNKLKKDYKLKQITAECDPATGEIVYILVGANGKMGFTDNPNTAAVAPVYDEVVFYPSVKAGQGEHYVYYKEMKCLSSPMQQKNIRRNDQKTTVGSLGSAHLDVSSDIDGTFLYWSQAMPAVVLGMTKDGFYNSNYTIYSTSGQRLRDKIRSRNRIWYFPGYFVVNAEPDMGGMVFGKRNNNGVSTKSVQATAGLVYERGNSNPQGQHIDACVFSQKGDLLVDSAYEVKFDFEALTVVANRKKAGMYMYGGADLKNFNNRVPTIFSKIFLTNTDYASLPRKWRVKLNLKDEMHEFDPSKDMVKKFHDKGEQLYEQRKYDDVIQYYAQEGFDAPWAKFFTGASITSNANALLRDASMVNYCVETNDEGSALTLMRLPSEYADFNDITNKYLVSKELIESYLATGNKEFEVGAKKTLEDIDDKIKETAKVEAKYKVNFPKVKPIINNYLAKKEAAEQEKLRQQQIRQQQIAARQQQIIATAFNSIFSVLTNAGRTGGNSYEAGTAGTTANVGGSTSSVTSSSASSSSASDNAIDKKHKEARVRQLEQQRTTFVNQLSRVEAEIANSKNPSHSALSLKQNCERHIRDIDNEITQIKNSY